MGAASPGLDPGPRAHRDLRRLGGSGRRHGDATGGPRSARAGALRLGLLVLPIGQPRRHCRGRARRRPARPRPALPRRADPVRGGPAGGGPGSLHVGARRRTLPAGVGRGCRARGGLRRHRAQPAGGATGPHDGGPVDRVGGSRDHRSRAGRRRGPPVRVALGLPRPHPCGGRGRPDRGPGADPPRPDGRTTGRGTPDSRRRALRGRRRAGPGRPRRTRPVARGGPVRPRRGGRRRTAAAPSPPRHAARRRPASLPPS